MSMIMRNKVSLRSISNNKSSIDSDRSIKLTSCKQCGAPLDIDHYLLQESGGICKCEYCDTFNYVW